MNKREANDPGAVPVDRDAVAAWIVRYLDGRLTPGEAAALRAALVAYDECRTLFVRLCRLHGELAELHAAQRAGAPPLPGRPDTDAAAPAVEEGMDPLGASPDETVIFPQGEVETGQFKPLTAPEQPEQSEPPRPRTRAKK